MKAKELRIGNTVYFRGGIWNIEPRCLEDIYHEYGDYKYYKPIPLTEEWLLKFGFEKTKKLYDNFSRSHYYLCKKEFMTFNLHESGDIFYMYEYEHIEYVHQLQNLYFALTNIELLIQK